MEKFPRTRDEYDPTTFLHTLSGGEKITVLDSRDLPEKWTEYNIKDPSGLRNLVRDQGVTWESTPVQEVSLSPPDYDLF